MDIGRAVDKGGQVMFWSERDNYKEFHAELLKEINAVPTCIARDIIWKDSSYHNDETGSVCYYHDNDMETLVQIHAYDIKEEYSEELELEKDGMYSVLVMVYGEQVFAESYLDRKTAIIQAVDRAKRLISSE